MNLIKRFFLLLTIFLGLFLLLTYVLGEGARAAQPPAPSRVDVIFLVDNSHSAHDYDKKDWRWHAVHLFVDHLKALDAADVDARVGVVIFAGDIISVTPLTPIAQIALPPTLMAHQNYSDLIPVY